MKKTPLYEAHLSLGAKMVPFAGWEMPLQYSGLLQEHAAVRNSVGIFDVGHMGVVKFNDTEALLTAQRKCLQRIIDDIPSGKIRYNRIINQNGGVVDDILVYKDFENFLAVFNAANVDKDINFFKQQGVNCELIGLNIIALQGPGSEEILKKYIDEEELNQIAYYGFMATELAEINVLVSRTGYTGEKGFELMASPEDCLKLWDIFISEKVTPCGLGARDTLRIEAGMPLYGHEMKDEWSPDKTDSITGIKMLEKGGVPRQGYLVYDQAGKEIGEVTSGTFSPTLQEPIAMVLIEEREIGSIIYVDIRGRKLKAEIVKLPFVSKVRK